MKSRIARQGTAFKIVRAISVRIISFRHSFISLGHSVVVSEHSVVGSEPGRIISVVVAVRLVSVVSVGVSRLSLRRTFVEIATSTAICRIPVAEIERLRR